MQPGHRTAYIGKWHMGEASDERRPGFDYWITHKGQGKYYEYNYERQFPYTPNVRGIRSLDWRSGLIMN